LSCEDKNTDCRPDLEPLNYTLLALIITTTKIEKADRNNTDQPYIQDSGNPFLSGFRGRIK
jgi:hypothetical protein